MSSKAVFFFFLRGNLISLLRFELAESQKTEERDMLVRSCVFVRRRVRVFAANALFVGSSVTARSPSQPFVSAGTLEYEISLMFIEKPDATAYEKEAVPWELS